MRVIAGTLGGRRLAAPAGRATRPTSDRVREALFAMLGDIAGATVLDLFAGSGALGIEALSRGAERAVFVERDRAALRALASNLAALELAEPRAEIRAGDAGRNLQSALRRRETYDLVFIDPPYDRAQRWGAGLTAALPAVLSPGGRAVVESSRRAPVDLRAPAERERRYGDTTITIYRYP
jgi:16S rRNA (guanine(966)-N(2))-methyltransferase RsmD